MRRAFIQSNVFSSNEPKGFCVRWDRSRWSKRPESPLAIQRVRGVSCTGYRCAWGAGRLTTRSPPGSRRGASMRVAVVETLREPAGDPSRSGRFLHRVPMCMGNGKAGHPQSPRLAPGGFYEDWLRAQRGACTLSGPMGTGSERSEMPVPFPARLGGAQRRARRQRRAPTFACGAHPSIPRTSRIVS